MTQTPDITDEKPDGSSRAQRYRLLAGASALSVTALVLAPSPAGADPGLHPDNDPSRPAPAAPVQSAGAAAARMVEEAQQEQGSAGATEAPIAVPPQPPAGASPAAARAVEEAPQPPSPGGAAQARMVEEAPLPPYPGSAAQARMVEEAPLPPYPGSAAQARMIEEAPLPPSPGSAAHARMIEEAPLPPSPGSAAHARMVEEAQEEMYPGNLAAVAPSGAGSGSQSFPTIGSVLGDEVERVLTDHPAIVDFAVDEVSALLSGLFPADPALAESATGTTSEAAARIAGLYPDGTPRVTDRGEEHGTAAPHSLGDIMDALNARSAHPGEIDVRVVETTAADGSVNKAAIVDLPGTKIWNLPGQYDENVQDLGTNINAMANRTTTYERDVQEALRRAGVLPGSSTPIMLVGHSQGGAVALHAAGQFRNAGLNVTHVVTVGSPTGEVPPPPEAVQALSLENRSDIYPHLDSAENPERANWKTVMVDHNHHAVGPNHSLYETYVPAARELDAGSDPSVRAFLDSARNFLHGSSATTKLYGVQRGR